ncbi:excisionase family DNA binding protein [Streptomyces phaeochromogenes]|jgi:excisionase family DNA binding protein|uniref:helix-turn-helix domain-containing protein n=1 Tax=Streptomyces TaxID=1883 RepID=UPI0021B0B181|nr:MULTISPECIES: helix-turn-helix domain-containing protein [Streptomyces]MDQ0951372.1 excisionase family DNA binding protein [Streptomyces phaeochromogenes]
MTGTTNMNRVANTPLITAELAADEAGVTTATIRKWVQRGHLRPAGTQGRRRLFRLEDVFAAERTTHLARHHDH